MHRAPDGVMSRFAADGGVGPSRNLFRDIGTFSGQENACAQWTLNTRTSVEECDVNVFNVLELACQAEVEIVMEEVAESNVME